MDLYFVSTSKLPGILGILLLYTKMSHLFRYIFQFFILFLYPLIAQTQWIDSAKKVLATQKADSNRIYTLIYLSDAYSFSNPDSGLVYGQQALSLSEQLHSDAGMFWSIVSINSSLYVLGNYALELDYAFKDLPLAKKLNTPYTIGFSNGILSDCYYNLGEYSTSLQYWREVMKICEQTIPEERFRVYGNTAHIFTGMRQYDSAFLYATKSYALFRQNDLFNKDNYDGRFAKSNIFIFLGDAFAGKGYLDSALFYYRMSIPFSGYARMGMNTMDAYNGIANVYNAKNNFDSAIWYAKKALAEKITNAYPIGMLNAANLLAAIYESKNNPDSSLKYLRISLRVKDSLFSREKTIAFQNIIFKEQEKQKEVQATTTALQTRYRMYFLISLLIISLIITGVIIRNRRIKQLKKIRNSIADDLHDDIGSTLSSISIMNELAKAKSTEALSLLTSIGESTTIIQENMSDIVWAIKAGNDRFENVLQRMNQFTSEILYAKNIELDFKSDLSLSALKLTMDQRKNFYLFFKEAINNVAKHSEANKVAVCIAQKDHYIIMRINDNGNGFNTDKISHGNGMSALKKRASELNAYFNITSFVNEGTTVQLKFKIT